MLPEWFVLQDPPDLDVSIDQWREYALRRARLLQELSEDPLTTVRDYFRGSRDELVKKYRESRLGNYLLRLVAATNQRIEAWLIESEGDLFEIMFSDRANLEQKKSIIKTIFGEENVMSINEFQSRMDERNNERIFTLKNALRSKDFLFCVHFSKVPMMVSNHRGYLRKGWVIGNLITFKGTIKKSFEKRLEQEIEKAKDKIGLRDDIDKAVLSITKELTGNIHLSSRSSNMDYDLQTSELFQHHDVYPPCMAFLYTEFINTGRLVHTSRLQLGFFLKKMGMTVEEQEKFWYEKSIDNVGLSYERFHRTSGYQIRHLYGLEGGKKDYNVPKCSTIATGYFCPFVHLNMISLKEFLQKNFLVKDKKLNNDRIDEIVMKSADNYNRACAMYFELVYGRSTRSIYHPLTWVRRASKIKGLLEENKDNNNQE